MNNQQSFIMDEKGGTESPPYLLKKIGGLLLFARRI
jgi:hypothetical protein